MVESRGVTWFVEKRILDRLPPEGGVREFHFGDFGKREVSFSPVENSGKPVEFKRFEAADPYMNAYKA